MISPSVDESSRTKYGVMHGEYLSLYKQLLQTRTCLFSMYAKTHVYRFRSPFSSLTTSHAAFSSPIYIRVLPSSFVYHFRAFFRVEFIFLVYVSYSRRQVLNISFCTRHAYFAHGTQFPKFRDFPHSLSTCFAQMKTTTLCNPHM